jgi:mannose-6-phosphate isomerase-like protein (cupin superfamily)
MKKLLQSGCIDMRNTMYPSTAHLVNNSVHVQLGWTTVYGVVYSGEVVLPNSKVATAQEYFCISNKTDLGQQIHVNGVAALFTRLGFIGQDVVGGPIEKSGRLCYIDGCSDSLLIYPPRKGDPSLNALMFPTGIDQSFHIHPSVRFGMVLNGNGTACFKNHEEPLIPGTVFCIEERELHRFKTADNETMTIVAYHPDGDWGPTDENHAMINRTYIQK